MRYHFAAILFCLFCIFFCSSVFAESITLTTYYPSPYGSYDELRANRMSVGRNYAAAPLSNGNLLVEGPVGIGTINPATELTVAREGSGSMPALDPFTLAVIANKGNLEGSPAYLSIISYNTDIAGINFGRQNYEKNGYIWYDNALDNLNFGVNGSQTMSLSNVGLGTTTPQYKLQVGSSNLDGTISSIVLAGKSMPYPTFGEMSAASTWSISTGGGEGTFGGRVLRFRDAVDGVERMSFCVGDVKLKANTINVTGGSGAYVVLQLNETATPGMNDWPAGIRFMRKREMAPYRTVQGDSLMRLECRGWGGQDDMGYLFDGDIISARIDAEVDAPPVTNAMPTAFVFYTSGTSPAALSERMRLTSDGRLGIGTIPVNVNRYQDPKLVLMANKGPLGGPDVTAGGDLILTDGPGEKDPGDVVFTDGANNQLGRVWANNLGTLAVPDASLCLSSNFSGGNTVEDIKIDKLGDVYIRDRLFVNSVEIVPPSDRRLKKNIKPMEGALEKVLRLQGVNFEWKDEKMAKQSPGIEMGMIAQEVEKEFPQWISTDQEGFKHITYRGFEGLAVESLRELNLKNKQLTEEIGALKTETEALIKKNNVLEERIVALEGKIK